MNPIDPLLTHLNLPQRAWKHYVPADNISRQSWQEAVLSMLDALTGELEYPIAEPSTAEISVHYHRPLREFEILLIRKRDDV